MRTKNVKRLWPVPATLAVVALAALLGLWAYWPPPAPSRRRLKATMRTVRCPTLLGMAVRPH